MFQFSDHLREKRQVRDNYRPLGQAPAYIQQLLQSQNARESPVHVPPQNVPKLNIPPTAQPQVVSQSQITQYRPQVTHSSGSQQPFHPQYNRPDIPQQLQPQYNRPIPPQQLQPQYNRPIIPQQHQPQYRPSYAQPQPQPLAQPNYNQPSPQYRSNLPPHLRQLQQLQHDLTLPSSLKV